MDSFISFNKQRFTACASATSELRRHLRLNKPAQYKKTHIYNMRAKGWRFNHKAVSTLYFLSRHFPDK